MFTKLCYRHWAQVARLCVSVIWCCPKRDRHLLSKSPRALGSFGIRRTEGRRWRKELPLSNLPNISPSGPLRLSGSDSRAGTGPGLLMAGSLLEKPSHITHVHTSHTRTHHMFRHHACTHHTCTHHTCTHHSAHITHIHKQHAYIHTCKHTHHIHTAHTQHTYAHQHSCTPIQKYHTPHKPHIHTTYTTHMCMLPVLLLRSLPPSDRIAHFFSTNIY